MTEYKYFLKVFYEDEWKEVSLEEFMMAERLAGFHVKGAGPTATGGFSGGGFRGRIGLDDDALLKGGKYGV